MRADRIRAHRSATIPPFPDGRLAAHRQSADRAPPSRPSGVLPLLRIPYALELAAAEFSPYAKP